MIYRIFQVKIPIILTLVLYSALTIQSFAFDHSAIKETPASPERKAIEFELRDQYNKSFAVRFPREKPLILVFGDRKGSSQIESWVRPLYQRYTNRVDIYGVAELSAVPYLLQGTIRQIFKLQVKYSVMLDWSGKVSKSYNYQPGRAHIFVINKNGDIIFNQTGPSTQSGLNKIYQIID